MALGRTDRAERQRQKDQDAEARVRQRTKDETTAKAEREYQEQLDALWTALSLEERTQLEQEVLVTLNAFTRKAYQQEKSAGREGPAHHSVRTGVSKLLAQRRGLSPLVSDPIRTLV